MHLKIFLRYNKEQIILTTFHLTLVFVLLRYELLIWLTCFYYVRCLFIFFINDPWQKWSLISLHPNLISLTLGSGCMTTIFLLAPVIMWGVKINFPKHYMRKETLQKTCPCDTAAQDTTGLALKGDALQICTRPRRRSALSESVLCTGRRCREELLRCCWTPPDKKSQSDGIAPKYTQTITKMWTLYTWVDLLPA